MHCPACGSALPRQMKYCTRCGAQTNRQEIEQAEERFDEYLDGLFWTAVFGLGFILGGAALLIKVLHFSQGLLIAYMILSSVVFLIIFGLSLWQTLRLARNLKKTDDEALPAPRDTNKILPAEGSTPRELAQNVIPSVTPSVTEDTTRSFEPITREHTAK